MSTVAEHPILFSAPMVRAILAGKKSQTRRIVNLRRVQHRVDWIGWTQLDDGQGWAAQHVSAAAFDCPDELERETRLSCPYGKPGDCLWVREPWAYFGGDEYLYQQEPKAVVFRANEGLYHEAINGPRWADKWRPSIHMPRWASRLLLEVTEVRVQRLQDISDADIEAEGLTEEVAANAIRPVADLRRLSWRALWDSINGKKAPWGSNPWVWAISFRALAGTPGHAAGPNATEAHHLPAKMADDPVQLSPEGRGVPLVRPGELESPPCSGERSRAGFDPSGGD